jgi:hypothetical protein
LRMSQNDPNPEAFTKALQYIRDGGVVGHGPVFNGLGGPQPTGVGTGAWEEGAPAPGYDPYPEPSANGY